MLCHIYSARSSLLAPAGVLSESFYDQVEEITAAAYPNDYKDECYFPRAYGKTTVRHFPQPPPIDKSLHPELLGVKSVINGYAGKVVNL